MTTNTDRAAQVIYNALSGQYGDFRRPTDAAEALADAGLITPDLPEPISPETHPEWAKAYIEEWDSPPPARLWTEDGSRFYMQVETSGETNGGFECAEEDWFALPVEQLEGIAAVLLAAAQYKKQVGNHTEQEQA